MVKYNVELEAVKRMINELLNISVEISISSLEYDSFHTEFGFRQRIKQWSRVSSIAAGIVAVATKTTNDQVSEL